MNVHYLVHVTGTDPGISGIPRVVKNLARELSATPGVRLVPVSWSKDLNALVHTEQRLLDNLARFGGPELSASSEACKTIDPTPGDWLLVAEAPHLASHDAAYPSLMVDRLIGFAHAAGLRVGAVFHDILPLTHHFGRERRRAFADMAPAAGGEDAERQRLRFAVYAHALALADLVLPVSQTSADLLAGWLVRQGHPAERLPPIEPILLPEESRTTARAVPHRAPWTGSGPIEFLTVGTVSTHKNQLAAMAAFERLVKRRPDLDIRLNVVGAAAPDVAPLASQFAKHAGGRIVLHGPLPDAAIDSLRDKARATVFVSLAEGYGLPVVESLWRGKPCLCSNDGSIAEIAAGGGCLTVDPRNLDEIEQGLETLATNAGRYDQLLKEIAAREMRSWRQYAGAVVDRLAACAEGRLESRPRFRRAAASGEVSDGAAPPLAMLALMSSDLSVPGAYAAGAQPIRRNGAIRFDRETHGAVGEDVLFFGPYVWLPAGRYAFAFDGELDGELELAFTAEGGARPIAVRTVSSFAEPVAIDLTEAAEAFEIVGRKTTSLQRLVLRGSSVEYRPVPQTAAPAPPSDARSPEDRGASRRAPAVNRPRPGRRRPP
ncbi:MAG TPA: glycosyltransferase, partial [Roseiarcus sp.]|nr:glycosyltransferase [Roseiarcus sp.]